MKQHPPQALVDNRIDPRIPDRDPAEVTEGRHRTTERIEAEPTQHLPQNNGHQLGRMSPPCVQVRRVNCANVIWGVFGLAKSQKLKEP